MVNDLPDQYSAGNNPVDNYDFDLVVQPINDSWANRAINVFALPVGILRRVMLNFPVGCNYRIRSNVYHMADQIVPIDATGVPGASFHAFNGFLLDFPTFRVIDAASIWFAIHGWTDGGVNVYWNHTISATFYVERVEVF